MPGDDNGTELLYESPTSGALNIGDDGKAFRVSDADTYDGPSLSGVQPAYGRSATQRGLGGSLVGDPTKDSEAPMKPAEVKVTAEDLMAQANAMEEKMYQEHVARMAQGPAVNPNEQLPQWLQQYMESQPEYQQGPSGVTMVDKVGNRKYLSEHEELKKRRNAERDSGRR